MRDGAGGRVVTALAAVGAGLAGIAGVIVVTLNLHIIAGLEQGYAATPAQVLDFSPGLFVFDLAMLVLVPLVAVAVVLRARRARPRS